MLNFKIKTISIVLLLLFTIKSEALSTVEIENNLETIWNDTKSRYLIYDKGYSEKSPWHRPRYKAQNQKKELVYIIHGFMGTPFEMKIFEEKSLEMGMDVYNDLIFGYGDNPNLANLTKNQMWIDTFYQKVKILMPHYEKIHFVGFSTGGLMISHLLIDSIVPNEKIGSINLISPFYDPAMFAGKFLLSLTAFFLDTLPTALPYNLIRYPDVVVMLNHPDNFMQKIPLDAASEVMDLADKFIEKSKNIQLNNLQIKVYMTPQDRVADYQFTKEFLPKVFNNLDFITLDKGRAPHHLMVESVSDHAAYLKSEFLKP